MPTSSSVPKHIDAYIAAFPPDVQARLQTLRQAVRAAVPRVEERISYGMPAFTLDGKYLVYFSAHKSHIGFYPAPLGVAEFETAIAPYASGKGTLQFPHDQRLPLGLVGRIVKFRVKESNAKAKVKSKGKKE